MNTQQQAHLLNINNGRFAVAYPEIQETFVTPVPSRAKPGQAIAHIGRQICFFEEDVSQADLVLGKPIKVMLTRALYKRDPETGHFDNTKILAIKIRPVTDAWALVAHDGFEISGSMCQTTATTIDRFNNLGQVSNNWRDKRIMLTPGRTAVHVTDNMDIDYRNSVNRTYGDGKSQRARQPRKPSWVYVPAEALKRERVIRIEGLSTVDDAQYAPYINSL